MNKEFNLETKDEIKRNIDHGVIRLATELKEEIDDNFNKANERLVNQQVLINSLKDRIDKAIEYIKQYGNLYCLKGKQFKDYQQYQDLLDILKGSDKE